MFKVRTSANHSHQLMKKIIEREASLCKHNLTRNIKYTLHLLHKSFTKFRFNVIEFTFDRRLQL